MAFLEFITLNAALWDIKRTDLQDRLRKNYHDLVDDETLISDCNEALDATRG